MLEDLMLMLMERKRKKRVLAGHSVTFYLQQEGIQTQHPSQLDAVLARACYSVAEGEETQ